jgi:hypothetical protein
MRRRTLNFRALPLYAMAALGSAGAAYQGRGWPLHLNDSRLNEQPVPNTAKAIRASTRNQVTPPGSGEAGESGHPTHLGGGADSRACASASAHER